QKRQDMLGIIEEIQQAAREPIKAGAIANEIYQAASVPLSRSRWREHTVFVAHGMGLITHEAPRLTSTGPVPYPGDDADKPLEAGMVILSKQRCSIRSADLSSWKIRSR